MGGLKLTERICCAMSYYVLFWLGCIGNVVIVPLRCTRNDLHGFAMHASANDSLKCTVEGLVVYESE